MLTNSKEVALSVSLLLSWTWNILLYILALTSCGFAFLFCGGFSFKKKVLHSYKSTETWIELQSHSRQKIAWNNKLDFIVWDISVSSCWGQSVVVQNWRHVKYVILAISYIWGKVFKNGPNKICGRQPLSRPYRLQIF